MCCNHCKRPFLFADRVTNCVDLDQTTHAKFYWKIYGISEVLMFVMFRPR